VGLSMPSDNITCMEFVPFSMKYPCFFNILVTDSTSHKVRAEMEQPNLIGLGKV